MRIVHVINKKVPPAGDEGGAPQSVAWLAEEQVRNGHDVFVMSTGSQAGSTYKNIKISEDIPLKDVINYLPGYTDIVHLHICRRDIEEELGRLGIPHVTHIRGNHIGRDNTSNNKIYVSRRHAENHHQTEYVYNGIPVSEYVFSSSKEDYLLFLSKVSRSKKGVDAAIRVAKATKQSLIIAGGRRLASLETWLPINKKIRPVGVVYGEKKIELLKNAKALIFPIKWEEPFGLVVIEALACGTPVIASRRGAMEEIIDDGVTGFICDTNEEMAEAVGRLSHIDPNACRKSVEDNFSIENTYRSCMKYYSRAISGAIW